MSNSGETGNGQRATGNPRLLTGDGQRATGNGQRAAREMRHGADIAERLVDFAVAVAVVVKSLPRDVAGRHVASQLFRAATAGGANYEEARSAESRPDFIHKITVAAKEVREAIFWIKLVSRARMTSLSLAAIQSEAQQLAAILFASARTARARLDE